MKKRVIVLGARLVGKAMAIDLARSFEVTHSWRVAHLVLDGSYSRKGISPPEYLGEDSSHFQFIVNYLKERGVQYTWKEI